MIVIADETKLSARLGTLVSVPVEVAQFGWQATQKRLSELGGNPALRPGKDGKPCVTDGGNYIIDCAFGPMENPKGDCAPPGPRCRDRSNTGCF